jgi:CRISPR/Cas system type I-B associated protein Csh2 (Cas7 group RAMP superfamily)
VKELKPPIIYILFVYLFFQMYREQHRAFKIITDVTMKRSTQDEVSAFMKALIKRSDKTELPNDFRSLHQELRQLV